MEEYVFLNGNIVPKVDAKISVWDIGILRGYGIYDGITAFGGKPFRFADHFQRFLNGAHALNLNVPITEEKAEKITVELLEKNNHKNRSNIRMILTGGPTMAGIEYNFETPTFYILTENFSPLPQELYTDGAKLVTYRNMRQTPEIKTLDYIKAVSLQNWKKEEGSVEILYTFDGEVLECATSNIFLVKDNVLITPAENILKGITRKVVLELIKENSKDDYKVEERVVEESELQNADEIFITSSFKDIVPITKIDDFVVNDGKVGPVTGDLIKRFNHAIIL